MTEYIYYKCGGSATRNILTASEKLFDRHAKSSAPHWIPWTPSRPDSKSWTS